MNLLTIIVVGVVSPGDRAVPGGRAGSRQIDRVVPGDPPDRVPGKFYQVAGYGPHLTLFTDLCLRGDSSTVPC